MTAKAQDVSGTVPRGQGLPLVLPLGDSLNGIDNSPPCRGGYKLQAEDWNHEQFYAFKKYFPSLYWADCTNGAIAAKKPDVQAVVMGDCKSQAQAAAKDNLPPSSYGDCDDLRYIKCGEGPVNIWLTYYVHQYFCVPDKIA